MIQSLTGVKVSTSHSVNTSVQHERYGPMAPMYYRAASAVLLCFSIDDRNSFISLINRFVPELYDVMHKLAIQPVMYILGLRSDLESTRQVSTIEAKVSIICVLLLCICLIFIRPFLIVLFVLGGCSCSEDEVL